MTLPAPVVMGFLAKLYYCLAGSAATPTWVEVVEVQNETVARTSKEADVTTRAMNGWEAVARALKSGEVSFEIPHQKANTHGAALIALWVSGALAGFAMSDIDQTVSGANVFTGDFIVTNYTQKKDASGAVMDSFTIKLTWPYTAAPAETVTT